MHLKGVLEYADVLRSIRQLAEVYGLKLERVFQSLEQAIEVVAVDQIGYSKVVVRVNRSTGDVSIFQEFEVVADKDMDEYRVSEKGYFMSSFSKAAELTEGGELSVGDIIRLPLEVNFGVRETGAVRGELLKLLRAAARVREYEDFVGCIGELKTAVVGRRYRKSGVVVSFDKADALLMDSEKLRGETLISGRVITVYISDVKRADHGFQIYVSRTHPNFLKKLFQMYIDEISDGRVQVISVARDPGFHSKIAVHAVDTSVDPVGACVGQSGMRIKRILEHLGGEKVDVVAYSQDLLTYVMKALVCDEVKKVVINEEESSVNVVVPGSSLSRVIGRAGRNVRLASRLVGWKINVKSEGEYSAEFNDLFKKKTEMFMSALGVDETLAQLLFTEGFDSVEDVFHCSESELEGMGLSSEKVTQILQRAEQYVAHIENEVQEKLTSLGLEEEVRNIFSSLSNREMYVLVENGVKTMEDLAGLDSYEVVDLLASAGVEVDDVQAGDIVMFARDKVGWLSE